MKFLGISDPTKLPKELADKILCIVVTLCTKYNFSSISRKGILRSARVTDTLKNRYLKLSPRL
jgi:hypothetical protein